MFFTSEVGLLACSDSWDTAWITVLVTVLQVLRHIMRLCLTCRFTGGLWQRWRTAIRGPFIVGTSIGSEHCHIDSGGMRWSNQLPVRQFLPKFPVLFNSN